MTEAAAPLRALIVDDEPPARRKIRLFLERDPQVEIVGEADSGKSASCAQRRSSSIPARLCSVSR